MFQKQKKCNFLILNTRSHGHIFYLCIMVVYSGSVNTAYIFGATTTVTTYNTNVSCTYKRASK